MAGLAAAIYTAVALIFVGVYFLWAGTVRSKDPVFKVLVARSQLCWKDNVYKFYQVAGILLIAFGLVYGGSSLLR
jgi:hypothetical protein